MANILDDEVLRSIAGESAGESNGDPMSAISRVAQDSGVNPAYLVGLAKLETQLGSKSIKGGGEDTRNLFNIKDFAGGGILARDKAEGSNDAYRKYASYDDSAKDLVSLLERKYSQALKAESPEEFAQALKKGGYATDPDYVNKLINVIGKGGAQPKKSAEFDVLPKGESIADLIRKEKENQPLARATRIYNDPEGGVVPALGSLVASALPSGGKREGAGSFLKDAALDAAQGVVGLGESAIGLGDIATMGMLGKGLAALGYEPKQTSEFLSGLQTDERQQSNREVQDTKGFFPTLAALGTHPSVLIGDIVQSLPGTIGAGAAAGLLVKRLAATAAVEAKALGYTGDVATKFIADKVKEQAFKIAATASGAEGAQSAGSTAEAGRQAGKDWTQYVGPAIAAGLGTTAIGMVSGKIGQKFGIGDVETDIAARSAGAKGAGIGVGNFATRTGKEVAKESLLEEMPQSYQEKIMENLATGRPWDEGSTEAAARGGLAGFGMAASHAVISGRQPEEKPKLADPIAEIGSSSSVDEAITKAADILAGTNPQPTTLGTQTNVTAGPGFDVGSLTAPTTQGILSASRQANDQADLDSLIASETRDLQVIDANRAQERQKQAELDQIQSTGTGQYGIAPEARPAVEQAATVEAPTAMQLALEKARLKAMRPTIPEVPAVPSGSPENTGVSPEIVRSSTGNSPVLTPEQQSATPHPNAQPGDITRNNGIPYQTENGARLRLSEVVKKGGSGEVVQIGEGAFVVRPKEANAKTPETVQVQPQQQTPAPDAIANRIDAPAEIQPAASGVPVETGAAQPGNDALNGNTPAQATEIKVPERTRYLVTKSPAYDGVEPLSAEDADFELEALENSANKGRLTPAVFAGSEIGKRLDAGTIIGLQTSLKSDPVGTIQALRKHIANKQAANVQNPAPAANQPAQSQESQDAGPNKVGRKDSAQIAQPENNNLAGAKQGPADAKQRPGDQRLVAKSKREDLGHLGRDSVPLTEGGKPFKTNKAAKDAKKNQPTMRVIRVEGGFALAPKTEAQIAAEARNARRLAVPRFGNPGVPLAAHEFVASRGGLRPNERSDMGIQGNVRVGNRFLFAGTTGMDMDSITEALKEAGYLRDSATHDDARNLIKRSLNNPQYTPEGTEKMAEREIEAQRAAFEAEQEAIAAAQEAEDNELDMAVAAFERAMDEIPKGLAQSDMSMEDALLVAGYTQQEIDDERSQNERAEADQSPAEAAPGESAQSDRGREGAQSQDSPAGSEEGLTSPTRADVLKQQADAEAEAKRKEDGGDKPLPRKELTGDVPDMFNTQGSVFDQPADPEAPAAPAPAAQATEILNAANITGKERIDALKDVKSGTITPDELKEAYPAKEEAKPLVAKEPEPTYSGTYETDLFGNPIPTPTGGVAPGRSKSAGVRGNVQPESSVSDTPAPSGDYYVNTLIASETKRELGASLIRTPVHAAQATQYLYKSAVERFDGIVTDKNGKPLAVVGGFKGAISQASVYPGTIMAEAIRIPGAANIWFSHNHPSGKSMLSAADKRLNETMTDVFRGSGIEPMGLLAVAGNDYSYVDANGSISNDPIPTAVARKSVPVMERQLADSSQAREVFSDPASARQAGRALYAKAKEPGIMLMDAQMGLAAWIPITKTMMGPLRGTGGAAAVYRAVSQSNASNAIIIHGGELDYAGIGNYQKYTPSENIAAALAKVDVRPIDSINVVTGKSSAEQGRPIADGPMFSRADNEAPKPQNQPNGTTVANLQAAIKAVTGVDGFNKLGRIVATTAADIKSTWEPLIGYGVNLESQESAGKAQAFYDPKSKTVFLIADNIREGDEEAVLAHELIHKWGKTVLGEEGWNRLHDVINSWKDAPTNSDERTVYDYARRHVEAVGMELSSEEMFPYAVEAAIKMGIKPSMAAKKGTVARWLESVKQNLAQVWAKVTGKPETFKAQDLVNLAFGIAQMENPEHSSVKHALNGPAAQTDTPAFKAWFGNSRVVDADGKPLVVYHGTKADFDAFKTTKSGEFGPAIYMTDSPREASEYGDGQGWGGPSGTRVMPLYAAIKNPYTKGVDAFWKEFGTGGSDAEGVAAAQAAGYDGIIAKRADRYYDNEAREFVDRGGMLTHYIAFKPTQIKSAIGNNGNFDAANPDIRFSRSTIVGQTNRQHTPEQLKAMKNVGFQVEVPTLKERAQALWQDAGKKMAQGIVDQFAPVKDLDKEAYGLLRLAKGASGAFESFLQGGKLKLTDGVYDFDEQNKGGVVDKLLIPLQGEHHDFMRWVAANRAERLTAEGKENLFTPEDIKALKTLADGKTDFDYTIQTGPNAGKATRDRTQIYADSLRVFNGFNKNILDMAEQSGLIDGESRKVWEHEFYVPFFRVADDADGGVRGMNIKGSVVRQQAFKLLKGGKQALNADLLDNTLMNWAHLLDASAKNRAAKATIEAAEKMGIATGGNQSTLAQMGSSIGNKNGVVWFMDQGQKRYSLVDDHYLLTALGALEYAGMRNPVMNAMSAFKHVLTVGVTASPFFKIRNLIRDSVQVIGTSKIGVNPAANIAQGWKLTDPKSDAYFRLLAGGGTIHFGTMMEGSEAKRVQALVESGVDEANILDSQSKVKTFYRKFIEPGITAYNELGNRGEAINRATLYDQLIKQGVSHADASLQARDLMDFSMQGSFTTIRFLTQVVPFLNARLQGLYKLGRAAKEDPARFSAVIGATALMSLSLLAAFGDDDDWKKREEWDRNGYWWFKFGGTAFRIPKPFEIGAIATLAERGFELAFDKEMTSKRFRQQVLALLGDNLSMNPVPQLIKPVIDVYANKDRFSGRPIESMGMERLKSEYRFNDRTSMTARALSTAANSVTGLVGVDSASPVQIDHMLRGYFGWLGSFVVGAGDIVARPATGQVGHATPDMWKVATGGMVSDLRDAPSRYVSQMYTQAREIEQAYGTYRELLKQGKTQEAQEFAADNREDLMKYHRIETVKKQESKLNERIRLIERSNMDGDTKRELIRSIQTQKDRVAHAVM